MKILEKREKDNAEIAQRLQQWREVKLLKAQLLKNHNCGFSGGSQVGYSGMLESQAQEKALMRPLQAVGAGSAFLDIMKHDKAGAI